MNDTVTEAVTQRQKLLQALSAWISQRPGLDYGDYGSRSSYDAEVRAITRDKRDAEALLAAVGWRDTSITYVDLCEALKRTYSGRLSWDGESLSYCTGQYWPTEYRKAACAALASAYWGALRQAYPHLDSDGLRRQARNEFGPGLTRRWFT